MVELLIYFVFLMTFFVLVFKVLRGLNIDSLFKKNHIFEIKAFYIIVSLVGAHVLTSIVLKFYEWISIIISR